MSRYTSTITERLLMWSRSSARCVLCMYIQYVCMNGNIYMHTRPAQVDFKCMHAHIPHICGRQASKTTHRQMHASAHIYRHTLSHTHTQTSISNHTQADACIRTYILTYTHTRRQASTTTHKWTSHAQC
jgi:hypothetical protein